MSTSGRPARQSWKWRENTTGRPQGCPRLPAPAWEMSTRYHRQSKLCGISLDFEFIRECMKINKIRLKFQFWTKIEIKMTYLVFASVFCYLLSLRLFGSWLVLTVRKMIKRLPNGSRGEETVNNKTQTYASNCFKPVKGFTFYMKHWAHST